LYQVDLPSVLRFHAAVAERFPERDSPPTSGTLVISDLQRFPCIMEYRKQARVNRLNPTIDQFGPGFDGLDGADRPLDSWEKLDHWSLGYWRRYDLFFGDDF
jgi:hypothetical protein